MDKKYQKWYEDHKGETGTQAALLNPNEGLETIRYKAAVELMKQHNYKYEFSVLDVGCGYGGLIAELPAEANYIGIEELDWICNEAKEQYDAQFICTSIEDFAEGMTLASQYTFAVALGVMATLEPGKEKEFVEAFTRTACNGVIVSFHLADAYKGKFRSYTPEDLARMFKTPVLKKNCITPEGDSTVIAYIPLSIA